MNPMPAAFSGLIDLASAQFGGHIVEQSDEFFGAASCMLEPGRGIWIDGKFTEQGKWVDGWETRRKRVPGNDWCVVALGAPGTVLALDIDTNHFSGNHPPFASVERAFVEPGGAGRGAPDWLPLLPPSPLRPTAQNLFIPDSREVATHLRLSIYPDGGVARFRAFGKVGNTWPPAEIDDVARAHVDGGWVDLAAAKNGGLSLACSDAYFGPMHNLLMPGRGVNMGDGWETRRKRGPGHDWILIQLGERGAPQMLEFDTLHFNGNYPDRCQVEAVDAAGASISELIGSSAWQSLCEETKLAASARRFVPVASPVVATHLRVSVFPDGGLSRFRAWGPRHG